jgi:hypothetical protein
LNIKLDEFSVCGSRVNAFKWAESAVCRMSLVELNMGTSKEDPHDLGGEIELWIDGKQNIIDKSFVAFLPAGVEHGPLTIRKIDKPILHFSVGMDKKYP